MIPRLVRFVLRMPAFVLILALGLLALGLYCYQQLDIEAYPNPVAPMIEIITQPTGWSAEEVERYVTIPLENGLNGMLDLDHIRSQSLFGLSDVKCYFTWNAEYHVAQQRVLNRLGFVEPAAGDDAAAVALERHRRGLPLRGARRGLLAGRSEDGPGLDPRAAVSPGPGRHRRGRLRRRDQGVPRRGRPLSSEGARGDADPAGDRAGVVESERRRPAALASASSHTTCAGSASFIRCPTSATWSSRRRRGRRSACATWPR